MNPPKVCLVAPGWLPVPATGGGAVESLMTTIAECNERFGLLDLTVVTRMDEASSHAAARFGTTRFVPIADAARPVAFWDHWYGALTRRIIPGYVPSNSYQRNVARLIDPADFDAIVLEAGPLPVPNVTAKRFSDRLWYHLHHVIDAPVANNAYRHVIGVSDFACDRFRSLCRNVDGLAPDVTTVRNGIDLSRFSALATRSKAAFDSRRQVRQQLGFDQRDCVVMYCGRLIEEKGVRELLQAMTMLDGTCVGSSADDAAIRLMVVGSSDFAPSTATAYTRQLDALARRLGRRVAFTGFVPNDRLWRYAAAADMQVVPSMFEDAAPTVCMEAVASGLPLVVTRSGGIGEYVSAQCALTIPRSGDVAAHLARALADLAADPHRRATMGAAALVRAQDFSRERFYHRFADALRQGCERQSDRSQPDRPQSYRSQPTQPAMRSAVQSEGRQ